MAEFEIVMSRINTNLTTFYERADKVVALANKAMEKLPAPLAWPVHNRLQALDSKLRAFNDIWTKTLANPGNPTGLRLKADGWNEQVAVRTSRAWSGTQDNVMHAYEYWQGRAAFAYRGLFSPHWNALTTTRQAANELNKFLNETAALIFEFWVKVALALISLVAAALGAVLALGGGAPGAAAGVGLLVAGLTAFVGLVNDLIETMSSKVQELKLKRLPLDAIKTQPPFADGRWPTPDGPGYQTIDNPDNWTLR